MQIARLPITMNGEYLCIREAMEACLTALLDESDSSFTVTFFDPQIPVLSFYIQVEDFNSDGQITVEVQRDPTAEKIVLGAKDARARVLGWAVPKGESRNPNYFQAWKLDRTSIRRVAEELLEAARYLGKVSPSAWVSFGDKKLTETIGRSGYLWRSINNPDLFCQMGHNLGSTVQGHKLFREASIAPSAQ